MLKPAAPPDEAARLSALRALDVLDTPAEERGVADHARAVRGGVAKARASGRATPRTATRWAGPNMTTRLMAACRGTSRA